MRAGSPRTNFGAIQRTFQPTAATTIDDNVGSGGAFYSIPPDLPTESQIDLIGRHQINRKE